MLEWTQGGRGARFELLVLHDDAAREYAYGPRGLPDVKLGAFPPALDEQAKKDGWTVVSMKNDWKQVFPFEHSSITAIDILLEPDATMLKHAAANNARLLAVFPKGFALDAAHRPHITMIQCFVRTADLDKIYAAEEKVFATANIKAMKLEAFKYLLRPRGCDGRRWHLRETDSGDPQATGGHHCRGKTVHAGNWPHRRVYRWHARSRHRRRHDPIRLDVCAENERREFQSPRQHRRRSREYLDHMLAEPFEVFTFTPAGAAVYQLGNYGTAAKTTQGVGFEALRP